MIVDKIKDCTVVNGVQYLFPTFFFLFSANIFQFVK